MELSSHFLRLKPWLVPITFLLLISVLIFPMLVCILLVDLDQTWILENILHGEIFSENKFDF